MMSATGTNLTKQQQRAVTTRGSSVLLSSGAGCGKTSVLTERYLSHLRNDEAEVGQIVAITFTELAAGEQLRTIPGEHVTRLKRDVPAASGDSLAPETLALIKARLGADLIVLGSYLALGQESGGQVRLDLRIHDTAAGETVASVAETGTEAEMLDLVARSGTWLRTSLGVAGREGEPEAARASLPSNPEAAPASDWMTTRWPCRTSSPTASGMRGARASPT